MIKMPGTLDEIMLIQPNNITFGQYELSEIQENILTLIIDAIQNYVTHKKELPRDLFNQPYVEIFCDEAGGLNTKTQVKKAIREMYNKPFSFKWLHPEIHKTIETTGTIISTMHDVKGTNRVVINFNVWSLPFLIYYGVGVGGTRFNKTMALKLRGDYTKRIYKILCRWKDKAFFTYKIDDFKKDLAIPDSYSNSRIKGKILDKAIEQMELLKSDVYFSYEMVCKYPKKGRKPMSDTIIFHIKLKNINELKTEQFREYSYVFYWMQRCFGQGSSKAQDITDKLLDMRVLLDVHKRTVYYDDLVVNGKMVTAHAVNSLKKMLKEEYNID